MRLHNTVVRWVPAAVCATFAATGFLSCLPLLEGDGTDLRGQEVRLTFLHTSDIHSRILPFDFTPLKTDVDLGLIPEAAPFGGATRMAAVLNRERQKADRVLHLDSGDCFQGAPIFNLNSGEVEFKVLSEARLDAAVIGNHEFDAGPLNFTNMARDYAQFPLLAANYIWEDHKTNGSNQTSLYTAPYSLHNVKGVRVGVIGMANISSLNSIVEGGNSLQVTPVEQNEAARAYVELLRPMVDLVVVVSHLGLHEDQDLVRGYDAFYRLKDVQKFVKAERGKAKWEIREYFGDPEDPEAVVRVFIPGVSGIDLILGGHLHVVLNPPQMLADPDGRRVVIAHSGAFAKYVGRLDVVVRMPNTEGNPNGAEISSHDFRVFPLDSLWCDDAMHAYYRSKFWAPGQFATDPKVKEAIARCSKLEDARTIKLLQPYILDMDQKLPLTNIFAYAPRDVARRNNSSGGDSPLGNLTADSMRRRRRVEAEVALTNSLGIRDNLYAGPVHHESMFNVFPFENTINVMYLSGHEMQEMFDFVTERSATRGCQSQAQISGARFTMDCAQAQLNEVRFPCDAKKTGDENGADCPQDNREGRSPWQCLVDDAGGVSGRCWAHSAVDITIREKPIDPGATYKVAVNDYIAKGGSGFSVLKRNTTRIETGISLRDSLIGYMQDFCDCGDINAGRTQNELGVACGQVVQTPAGPTIIVDEQVIAYCKAADTYQEEVDKKVGPEGCTCSAVLQQNKKACGEGVATLLAQCPVSPGPNVGTCACRDVLKNDTAACGPITQQLRTFCTSPGSMAVAIGYEDGRIGRRVK